MDNVKVTIPFHYVISNSYVLQYHERVKTKRLFFVHLWLRRRRRLIIDIISGGRPSPCAFPSRALRRQVGCCAIATVDNKFSYSPRAFSVVRAPIYGDSGVSCARSLVDCGGAPPCRAYGLLVTK
uniref:Uncharacterized protein n=1 Tax=Steinernema glaseri TaxID=37863 RepID=A0A1I8ABV1_9BILA